ncbi:MAG: hypothetical protein ACREOI_12150 [bacterium]
MKINILTFSLGFGLLLLAMNPVSAQEPQPRPRGEVPLVPEKSMSITPMADVELTPEMEKDAFEYIAKLNPRGVDELLEMKAINLREYTVRISKILRERYQLERLQKEDPTRFERESKLRELERQSHELGESYRKAQDEAARKMLRSNLASVITQLFDLREMNRQEEVKRMEAELKRLKDTLAQRQQNRMSIIERRIQQLTGEAGAMEWE